MPDDRAPDDRAPDDRAPDELIRAHLGLASALAARYRNRGVPWEDLEQIARLGLVKAAAGYRTEHGTAFGTYATPTITGELRRYFRDHGWCVRPPRRLQELRSQLLAETAGREVPDEVLAERLGATVEELRQARAASNAYSAVSLDVPRTEDEESAIVDALRDPHDAMARVDDLVTLDGMLAEFDAQDRWLLHQRFVAELTQSQIARRLGVSQMQVSRLLKALLGRLRAGFGIAPTAVDQDSLGQAA